MIGGLPSSVDQTEGAGFIGLVGYPDPCSEGALADNISIYAQVCVSFQDSPYGLTYDFPGLTTMIPYLIDPVTLKIEYRPDLAISALDRPAIVLDDSTMIIEHRASNVSSFYVVTRSGIAISVSGAQASVTVAPTGSVSYCRADSSHIVRAYTPPFGLGNPTRVVETYSVSGGTVSLVSSDTIIVNPIVTNDPGPTPPTVTLSVDFFPFHYDGSGTLYWYGRTQGFPGFQRICASPYTPGGGIGTLGLSTRAKDAQSLLAALLWGAKIGTNECLLKATGSAAVPFYDDGTNMHFTTSSSTWGTFQPLDHNTENDQETTQGDYLTDDVAELPPGTPVGSGPALVSQSGLSLSYTPIAPIFRCPQFGTGITDGVRHGSNLGAQIITNPFGAGGLLRAFRW